MNPIKKLTDLVALKNVNLNLIADLLNTPNADLRLLQNAKDTQEYLNYQISLLKKQVNIKLPIPVINSPLFQENDNSSFFSSFNSFTPNNTLVDAKQWEYDAQQLLPKEMSVINYETVIKQRNKEEIIFRPSQEQLSGTVHLPEDNWAQNLPTTIVSSQKIEPIKEQLMYNPIGECEKASNFIQMPENTFETEQAVQRDLRSLRENLQQDTVQTEENFYSDPYNEY